MNGKITILVFYLSIGWIFWFDVVTMNMRQAQDRNSKTDNHSSYKVQLSKPSLSYREKVYNFVQ